MGYMEELENLGVNVAESIDRVMGDEALYREMLGMFVDSVRESGISPEEFESGDLEGLANRVHMLKGMSGNLSLTPVFESYKEILRLLRDGKPGEAKELAEKLLPIQEKIVECIERNRD